MTIFKNKASALFLATLMVMGTLLSSCDAKNEVTCSPPKCYELDFPNCTLESCKKFCKNDGGQCTSSDGCCCPVG
ncbi:hypothetical protein ZWY2020_025894 [Hordeum vulgare]|nr:hypothetical protein ZWY2020_025894 [Hordeum vulgare]